MTLITMTVAGGHGWHEDYVLKNHLHNCSHILAWSFRTQIYRTIGKLMGIGDGDKETRLTVVSMRFGCQSAKIWAQVKQALTSRPHWWEERYGVTQASGLWIHVSWNVYVPNRLSSCPADIAIPTWQKLIHVIINETEGWNCRQIEQVEGSDKPKCVQGIDWTSWMVQEIMFKCPHM